MDPNLGVLFVIDIRPNMTKLLNRSLRGNARPQLAISGVTRLRVRDQP
jgi:hypothetical protein